MRIGIDARFLGEAGGIARYIQQLIQNLENIDHKNEYVIFLRRENWNEFESSNPRFSKYLTDIPWYGIKEQLFLSHRIKQAKVDLMHFPHWNIPLLYHAPFVVTIHDLILLNFPSMRATTRSRALYFFKQLAYKLTLKHAIHASHHILTPSEFTKKEILQKYAVPQEKITVTYEGVDISSTEYAQEYAQNFLNKFGIQKPYILYVGVAYPHKNLEWLAQTMSTYNAKKSKKIQTVYVGKENYFYKRMKQEFAISIKNKELVLTGFVPDNLLSILFKNASAYVFPSLYEGFGLPPLQACAYKTPVLSSNRTSMPEILGDAALYFDPADTLDFCSKLNTILTDQKTREILIQNGFRHYQQFSWNKMAQTSLRVYEK